MGAAGPSGAGRRPGRAGRPGRLAGHRADAGRVDAPLTAVLGQYANVGSVSAQWAADGKSGSATERDASHYLGVTPEESTGHKVTLCHRTGAGFFVKIDVDQDAEPAHLAHGDGYPGKAVPGQTGKTFTASCGIQ